MRLLAKAVLFLAWGQWPAGAQRAGLTVRHIEGEDDENPGLSDRAGGGWMEQALDSQSDEIVPLGPRVRFAMPPPTLTSPDEAWAERTAQALAAEATEAAAPGAQAPTQRSPSGDAGVAPTPRSAWEGEDLAYDQDEDNAGHATDARTHGLVTSGDSLDGDFPGVDAPGDVGGDARSGDGFGNEGVLPAAGWGQLRGRVVVVGDDGKRLSGVGEEVYEDGSR
jgi:hypothetical protein